MGNQRSGTTKGVVYVVIWGEQVIPLMRVPQVGTQALFDNKTNSFVEGAIQWSIESNAFVFTVK